MACSFQIYRRQVKEKANRIRKDLSLRKKKGNIRPGESQRVLREMTRQKLGAEAVDMSRSSFLKIWTHLLPPYSTYIYTYEIIIA